MAREKKKIKISVTWCKRQQTLTDHLAKQRYTLTLTHLYVVWNGNSNKSEKECIEYYTVQCTLSFAFDYIDNGTVIQSHYRLSVRDAK